MLHPRFTWNWLLLAVALDGCTVSNSNDAVKSNRSANYSNLEPGRVTNQVAVFQKQDDSEAIEHRARRPASNSGDSEAEGPADSLCGWDVRQDQVTLQGIATGMSFSDGDFGDGDWSLFVRPDPGYEYLLIHSFGLPNLDGTVECEVEPPFRVWEEVHGYSYLDNLYAMEAFFRPLIGQRVTVVGTGCRTWPWPTTALTTSRC